MILEMLWLAYHNPEIDWKTSKIKMIRCSNKYGKLLDMVHTRR